VATPFTKGMCCFRVARLHNPFVLNTNNTQWPATATPFLNPQMGLDLRSFHKRYRCCALPGACGVHTCEVLQLNAGSLCLPGRLVVFLQLDGPYDLQGN
jgi:hypothetical protein